jgi:hypothetical protein
MIIGSSGSLSTDSLIPPFKGRARSPMKQVHKIGETKMRSSVCALKKIRKFALLSLVIVILATYTFHAEAVTLKQVDKTLTNHQEAYSYDSQYWNTSSGYYWIESWPIPVEFPFRDSVGRRIAIPTQEMLNLLSTDKKFPGWTFQLSANPAPGEFRIIQWDIKKNLPGGPDPNNFTLDYVSGDPNFPPAGQVARWIQWVFTNVPSGFASDGRPNATNGAWTLYRDGEKRDSPFYGASFGADGYGGSWLNPPGVTLRFVDKPYRPLNEKSVYWQAYLFLVTWDSTKNVTTFYDGIVYGFTIRRTCDGSGPDINGGVGGDTDELGENVTTEPYVPGYFPVDVIALTASPTPGQVGIALEVENEGCEVCDFSVKVYADKDLPILGNGITIGQQSFYGVNPDENRSLYLTWDTSGVPENYYWISAEATLNGSSQVEYLTPPVWVAPTLTPSVGGFSFPISVVSSDKPVLLAPYIGLASTAIAATVATAVYAKRFKRRKERQ